jgi:peptidoglycan/xylan/chitin deacetylase (PgdA/CDA1 family)
MIGRLLKLLIAILFYVNYQCIVMIFSLLKKKLPGTVTTITYHSIKPDQHLKFKKQMEDLTKLGTPISADFTDPVKRGAHYIAVTFDDGFRNILYSALPFMRERKIPATIFVPTGYLGKKPGWINDLTHPNANEVLLTEEQIINLTDDQFTIGSHTVSHPHLKTVDNNTFVTEITDSKKKLEEILRKQINLISLPYGSLNTGYIDLFKEAGYQHVFLNIPTFPATKIKEYFIGRIDVSLDDWPVEYRLKLLGAYQWLPLAIKIKKKINIIIKPFLKVIGKQQ